jgi:hypothetical protein
LLRYLVDGLAQVEQGLAASCDKLRGGACIL